MKLSFVALTLSLSSSAFGFSYLDSLTGNNRPASAGLTSYAPTQGKPKAPSSSGLPTYLDSVNNDGGESFSPYGGGSPPKTSSSSGSGVPTYLDAMTSAASPGSSNGQQASTPAAKYVPSFGGTSLVELPASGSQEEEEMVQKGYSSWCQKHGKQADPQRYPVFKQNYIKQLTHDMATGRFYFLNEFGDMTEQEFMQARAASPAGGPAAPAAAAAPQSPPTVAAPKIVQGQSLVPVKTPRTLLGRTSFSVAPLSPAHMDTFKAPFLSAAGASEDTDNTSVTRVVGAQEGASAAFFSGSRRDLTYINKASTGSPINPPNTGVALMPFGF